MYFSYKYEKGVFLTRNNRFLADVKVNGEIIKAHVPNTGRMGELLIPGAEVFVSWQQGEKRKTSWDLRFVSYKGKLVSIDSQLPNKLVEEYLINKEFTAFADISLIRREFNFGESRLDFFLETKKEKCLMEVKGITLERNNWGYFPDAPTTRGKKHLFELIKAKNMGYRAAIVFVIQNPLAEGFTPNRETDKAFSEAIIEANESGVEIYCLKTENSLNEVKITGTLPVILKGD